MSKHTNRPNSIVIPPSMRHSSHVEEIERLEADMAVYLAKGGTIKPVVVREVVAHETIVQGD